MDEDRTRDRREDMPNRSSNMEQAEGSRESYAGAGAIRNRPEDDLGTSSDRAMFEDRESADERDDASHERSRSNSGGITNRPLDREQSEQERLPGRGRSQSDSEC